MHVAVPALCGYLKARGLPVQQRDLNIEFYRWVISKANLRALDDQAAGTLPPPVVRARDFVQQYRSIAAAPLPPGYCSRFSDDAEGMLLSQALLLLNHRYPETTFTSMAVYHCGDADSSHYIADFAARESGNAFADFYRDSVLPELAARPPKLLGISVSGPFQLAAAFTLARVAKQVEPKLFVVIGGAFFSTLPRVLLEEATAARLFAHVDAFVFNEGELPLAQLIDDLSRGGPVRASPNVLLHGERLLRYEPAHCVDSGDIAIPDFVDAAVESYFRPRKRIPIEVSRGCYWGRCSFCNLATGANERYRALPLATILAAVDELTQKHRAHEILFSTLAMSPKLLRCVAQGLVDSGRKVEWRAWVRAERTLSEADVELFLRAGCRSLDITPESFNARTLQRMNKGFDPADLVRVVKLLRQAGLCDGINIIPGFPGEKLEDFMGTMQVCRELGLHGELFPFHLLRNSPVYEQPERFGIAFDEEADKDLAFALPYRFLGREAGARGVELIQAAAARYPGFIRADDPLAGYTFDFSSAAPPAGKGRC